MSRTIGKLAAMQVAGPSRHHPRADIEPSRARRRIMREYLSISTANKIDPDEVAST
jgi:hypothetical protein